MKTLVKIKTFLILVIIKMREETKGIAIEKKIVGLKMYSFMVEDKSEHKKSKIMNKNVFPKRILSEYKDVLLNDKRLRHSINRI